MSGFRCQRVDLALTLGQLSLGGKAFAKTGADYTSGPCLLQAQSLFGGFLISL